MSLFWVGNLIFCRNCDSSKDTSRWFCSAITRSLSHRLAFIAAQKNATWFHSIISFNLDLLYAAYETEKTNDSGDSAAYRGRKQLVARLIIINCERMEKENLSSITSRTFSRFLSIKSDSIAVKATRKLLQAITNWGACLANVGWRMRLIEDGMRRNRKREKERS